MDSGIDLQPVHPERRMDYLTWPEFKEWMLEHERRDRDAYQQINSKLDTLTGKLLGDDGLYMRVDRLEQLSKQRSQLVDWLLKGGLGGAGVWFATQFLDGKFLK